MYIRHHCFSQVECILQSVAHEVSYTSNTLYLLNSAQIICDSVVLYAWLFTVL